MNTIGIILYSLSALIFIAFIFSSIRSNLKRKSRKAFLIQQEQESIRHLNSIFGAGTYSW